MQKFLVDWDSSLRYVLLLTPVRDLFNSQTVPVTNCDPPQWHNIKASNATAFLALYYEESPKLFGYLIGLGLVSI